MSAILWPPRRQGANAALLRPWRSWRPLITNASRRRRDNQRAWRNPVAAGIAAAMKFALHAVGCGSTARPEVLGAGGAQKAEALGFESVWLPEHLIVPLEMRSPYPYSADGKFPGGATVALHDPFVALAYVAACRAHQARHRRLTCCRCATRSSVAKAAASLDVLSNGRFLFGVGVGWLADEFAAAGMPFADRAARTREAIRLMRTLWSEDTPSFAGRFHQRAAERLQPQAGAAARPADHPRRRDRRRRCGALRRSATAGSASRIPLTASGPLLATLREHLAAAGRGAGGFEISVGTAPGVTPRPRRHPRVRRRRRPPPVRLQPRLRPARASWPAISIRRWSAFAAEHIGA